MWWLEEAAKLAPIVTASMALAAVSLAWRTLHVNRRIARQRAAIDFVTKMTTDPNIIAVLKNLSESVEKIMKAVASRTEVPDDDFHKFFSAINLFETMAGGINTGALDDDICYRTLSTEVLMMFEDTEALRARLKGLLADHAADHPW